MDRCCFIFLGKRRPPRSELFPSTTPFLSPSVHSTGRAGPSSRKRISTGSTRANSSPSRSAGTTAASNRPVEISIQRSEEHTSELQSRQYLVCRLLLEKKHTFSLSVRLHLI